MGFLNDFFAMLLRFFYSFTNNYALALIFFTLVVKGAFVFINIIQHKNAVGQARIKPKMLAIRKRYEGRKDRYIQIEYQNDVMKLNQEENVKATSGCLPLLIQLFVVMILFSIINAPLTYISQVEAADMTAIKQTVISNISQLEVSESIKTAVANVATADNLAVSEMQLVSIIQSKPDLFADFFPTKYTLPDFTVFGGAIDLAKTPTFSFDLIALIPVLTVLAQLASVFVTKLVCPKPDLSTPEAVAQNKSMLITNLIMCLVTGYFAFTFPAIIGVYWVYQSIIGTVITVILHKAMPVPVYTEAEVEAIIEEYNRDYVRPEIPTGASLHNIDDDEEYDDEDYDDDEGEDDDGEGEGEPKSHYDDIQMPERRRYDKNGNKIRSLHFIDEDEDEATPENTDNPDEDDKK